MRVSSPLKTALQKMLLNMLVNSLGRFRMTDGNLGCANNSAGKLFLYLIDSMLVCAPVLEGWVT